MASGTLRKNMTDCALLRVCCIITACCAADVGTGLAEVAGQHATFFDSFANQCGGPVILNNSIGWWERHIVPPTWAI
jgi:hypothetical protein